MTHAAPSMPGSSPAHKRMFDCPWCGAISPVPGDHLGEHFVCGECKKSTKLTEKNSSVEGAKPAPSDTTHHLSGDRTFDCPWCGAIAGVPSSHLGERFACPECKKDTRLTSTNTRRAPITAPPPEAPTAAPVGSSVGLWAAIGVVVVGGMAWALLSGGSSGADGKSSTETGVTEPATTVEFAAADSRPSASTPPPMGGAPPSVPEPPPGPANPRVPMGQPTPKAMDLDLAKGMLAKAVSDLATAERARISAQAKYDEWTKDNPDIVEMEAKHAALRSIAGESKRLKEATPALSDPAKTTPADAQAFDAAMVKFVAAVPLRVAVVEEALKRIRGEIAGRGVGPDWKALSFHGAAFHRALAAFDEAYGGMSGNRPPELMKAVEDATAAIVAAAKAKADAEAQIATLESAPK